jgi:hypothetical protein
LSRGLAASSLLLLLVLSAEAAADDSESDSASAYGAAAGVALPLEPVERPGVALALSAALTDLQQTAPALLMVRGEIVGLIASEGKAIMPTLTGDVGVALGPAQIFFSGGVQIFGVTWRGDYTFFTTFGLTGGGGLRFRLHEALSLELRGAVVWLPEFAAAKLREPASAGEGEGLPTLLFFHGLLGVVYSP